MAPNARERARLAAEQEARRRRDRRLLIAIVVGFVVAVVAAGMGIQAYRTSRAPSAVPTPAATGSARATIVDGQPLTFGSGPRIVGLYEDFHCPHCAEFEETYGSTLDGAIADGIATVQLYPMSFIDAGSATAANGMACAAEAGFGAAYYRGLFANRTLQWNDEQLIDLAGKVGGTATDDFRSCVTTKRHGGWVESINAAADAKGVKSTPTLFIDDLEVGVAKLTPQALTQLLTQQGAAR